MSSDAVLETFPLQSQWPAADPFLFCVHHLDAYPAGDERMAPPRAALAGRQIGSDFSGKDGWSMYHGGVVPGFPPHPHRGFETITIARQGYIDHSDSLGARARFGHGDVQWMTAGKGVVHAEMFPLVQADAPNTTELFQIWLNLPRASKMVEPHFTMLWAEQVPQLTHEDAGGKVTQARLIAGALGEHAPPAPPPDSWASDARSDLLIVTARMEPGATWSLPAAPEGVHRILYFFEGAALSVEGATLSPRHGALVDPTEALALENTGDDEVEFLVLQGRPIGEPVAQHGPFVMNTQAEIRQAMVDYQRTQFGGWPWPGNEIVHPRDRGRFAEHADGRVEEPGGE